MAGRTLSHPRVCEKKWAIKCVLFIVLFSIEGGNCDGTQCLSQTGKPVDWFIIYKLPEGHMPEDSFYYMDADKPHWQLSPTTLKDTSGQAVYHTLQQIYASTPEAGEKQDTLKWRSLTLSQEPRIKSGANLLYAMYNDNPAKDHESQVDESEGQFYSEKKGHTKGVIGFDDKTGFWIIQSTPQFPIPRAEGYRWPSNGNQYAQHFLCVSMATDTNLEELGKQFTYNYPHFYDKSVPTAMVDRYPVMTGALNGDHRKSGPWNRTTVLTSLAGKKFHSFAKSAEFDADLYSTWIAPTLGNNLLVESWQNGRNKLCSNCTGTYKVYNVATVHFMEKDVSFTETRDHAKWVVTNNTRTGAWTCLGDINRQESQEKRGGGTVCTDDNNIWSAFRSLISNYHDCRIYKKCVRDV